MKICHPFRIQRLVERSGWHDVYSLRKTIKKWSGMAFLPNGRCEPGSVEEGAVAVEFAITASLLLLLVLGAISFGLQFGVRIVATQAASEGARAAAAGLSASERQSLALAAAQNLLNSYGGIASVNSVKVTDIGNPVTNVQVQVQVDISKFGLNSFAALVPINTNTPSATVSVQVGGY